MCTNSRNFMRRRKAAQKHNGAPSKFHSRRRVFALKASYFLLSTWSLICFPKKLQFCLISQNAIFSQKPLNLSLALLYIYFFFLWSPLGSASMELIVIQKMFLEFSLNVFEYCSWLFVYHLLHPLIIYNALSCTINYPSIIFSSGSSLLGWLWSTSGVVKELLMTFTNLFQTRLQRWDFQGYKSVIRDIDLLQREKGSVI